MGVCVARSGPGAGRNSAGPRKGVCMKVAAAAAAVAALPTGWRSASGLVAIVHRAGGVSWPGRKPDVRLFANCFCKASLVCRQSQEEREEPEGVGEEPEGRGQCECEHFSSQVFTIVVVPVVLQL